MKVNGHLCPLCQTVTPRIILSKKSGELYYDCPHCRLIFLDANFYLAEDEEKERYLTHNNDTNDPRYHQFVSPITDFVTTHLKEQSEGLDFGSGAGPMTSLILETKNYRMSKFDPYFSYYPKLLERQYDFVVSCEVIEHLYHPAIEFKRLRNILKENSPLILMTHIYDDKSISFDHWYYHRDPTHVLFYRQETFQWIQQKFQFRKVEIKSERLIIFWS